MAVTNAVYACLATVYACGVSAVAALALASFVGASLAAAATVAAEELAPHGASELRRRGVPTELATKLWVNEARDETSASMTTSGGLGVSRKLAISYSSGCAGMG